MPISNTSGRRNAIVIAAGLVAVVAAIGVGVTLGRSQSDSGVTTGPSAYSASASTDSASSEVTDAARVFCVKQPQAVLDAADSLGILPAAVVDESDPRFR